MRDRLNTVLEPMPAAIAVFRTNSGVTVINQANNVVFAATTSSVNRYSYSYGVQDGSTPQHLRAKLCGLQTAKARHDYSIVGSVSS